MRQLAQMTAMLVAALSAGGVARAANPAHSATVVGPSNAQLADGAAALEAGRIEDGIRLTLAGLNQPAPSQDRAAGHSNLCAGYAMLKQWDEALHHCNAALEIDGSNWRGFNNRAAVYVGKGEYELAMNDLRAGLEIAPNSRILLESLRIVQQNKRILGARSRSSVRP